MIQMTKQDIEAHDLRKAAIHECGHACVTRHYGMGGSPALWRNDNDNYSVEKLWLGTTHYEEFASTPLRLRRVCIAGFLAEEISQFDSLTDCEESTLAECLESSIGECFDDSDGWSRSDWEGAWGWTGVDLHVVFVILMRNWKYLLEEVEMLVDVASKSGSAISNTREEPLGDHPEVGKGGKPISDGTVNQARDREPSRIARNTPAARVVIPSKTRLKLTVVDRRRKDQFLQDLLEASCRVIVDSQETSHSGSEEGGKIRSLSRSYRPLINKVNSFIAAVHSDQLEYFSAQSEEWRDSENGQVYRQWIDEWGVEISLDELLKPGEGDDPEFNALGILQELPDEPSV